MKSKVYGLLFISLAMLLASSAVYADSFTLNTLPASGQITGAPGSSIGWGYTIVNLSSNWLVTTALSADIFLHGTPDALLFDFPIVAPGASTSVVFNSVAFLGLFGLNWDGNAPTGFTNSGNFILSAEFWDGNPLIGGIFVSSAEDQSSPYSATVSAVATVPEPTSLFLLSLGIISLAVLQPEFPKNKPPSRT